MPRVRASAAIILGWQGIMCAARKSGCLGRLSIAIRTVFALALVSCALEVQAGVAIRGKNPALNMEVMNEELKKQCVTILTEQHFDLFNAIQTGSYGVPQINIFENAAEGPYVRFFEQAFEWEQMTWLTYPYF